MEKLSLHERIRNMTASQAVENVKARHAYYHGRADATREWGTIWSRSDDISWAHIFGRMRGFDQVWYGSVTLYDYDAFDTFNGLYQKYPEVGGKDPRPLMEASVHMLATDVIEVAADGQTARGSFITPGVIFSHLTPEDEPYCLTLWERYGSDFICEDGQWKYLHEQVCPDIPTALDSNNWAADEYQRLIDTNQLHKRFGPPSPPPCADPGPLHLPYSILGKPQNTCPWPEPYETMDERNTYTPPRKPKAGAEEEST